MLEIAFITVVGQILLPLALVIRLGRSRCRTRTEWLLQTASVAAFLALIAVAGIWLLVPWYLPYGFAALTVAAAAASWRRCGRSLSRPEGRFSAGFRIGCHLALAVFCMGMVAWSLSGHQPPVEPQVVLTSPLKNGAFYVINGGYSLIINPHMKALARESLSAYRAQSYAVDIVRLDRFGRRADGWSPGDLQRYHIFSEPVYAPCAGEVMRTEDRRPDLTPPDRDRQHPAGNYVLLGCGETGVLLAHLMKSSLSVKPGDHVQAGQRIARVGNSGLSTEPHLHLHVQSRSAAEDFLAGEPLPFKINDRIPVRNSRLIIE
ncbi:MAG: M23 family metallopeptidase [Hyphomicrobiales bacterium]